MRPHDLAFYVNDEPGIWSFPINRANDINQLIKERFPMCATCMAVVRPRVCRDYRWSADYFMLDQYPVPFMPMTWLSDCMGECTEQLRSPRTEVSRQKLKAKRAESEKVGRIEGKKVTPVEHPHVPSSGATGQAERGPDSTGQGGLEGQNRLAAVIQAFGGKQWEDVGWPRLPTEREMECLAFLSVVHGSRAIFFYTYGIMGKTEEGRQALGRVVGRLNQVYPWLVVENSREQVKVEMLPENRFDPKGRPAVHGCWKRKGNGRIVDCSEHDRDECGVLAIR